MCRFMLDELVLIIKKVFVSWEKQVCLWCLFWLKNCVRHICLWIYHEKMIVLPPSKFSWWNYTPIFTCVWVHVMQSHFLAIIMVSSKLIRWNRISEYCTFMYCNCHKYYLLDLIDRSDTWHPSAGVRTRDTYDSYSGDGTWQGTSGYEKPRSWISPTHHSQLPTTRQSRVCELLFFIWLILGHGRNVKQLK